MLVDERLAPDSPLLGRAASSEGASVPAYGDGDFLGDGGLPDAPSLSA